MDNHNKIAVNGQLAKIILKKIADTPLWAIEIPVKDINIATTLLMQALDRMVEFNLIFPVPAVPCVDTTPFSQMVIKSDSNIQLMMTDLGKA